MLNYFPQKPSLALKYYNDSGSKMPQTKAILMDIYFNPVFHSDDVITSIQAEG